MIIQKTETGYMASHTIEGINEEGVWSNLEGIEYRCASLEAATAFATQRLTERNIQEEIIYEDVALPDGEPTPQVE